MSSPQLTVRRKHQNIIDAIQGYYEFLTTMPHVDRACLLCPPEPEGWPGLDVEKLEAHGITQDAIDLLRHLPYLKDPNGAGKIPVTPMCLSLAYSDGEVIPDWLDKAQPTPPHVIWLTTVGNRDDGSLLLDLEQGTITDWTILQTNIILGEDNTITGEEWEALDPKEKWKAFPSMPVADFFNLCRRRLEKLLWIPVPDLSAQNATSKIYVRPGNYIEEEDMLLSDDEYTASDDSSDDDDDLDTAGQLSSDEIDDLMADAGSEGNRYEPEDDLTEEVRRSEPPIDEDEPPDNFPEAWKEEFRDKVQLCKIYRRNGWPQSFNREQCKAELTTWLEDSKAEFAKRHLN